MSTSPVAGLLFDLDGTLLDTAPDMLATVNTLRARRDLAPVPMAGFRDQVSRGARAMIAAGMPESASDDPQASAALVAEFLAAYQADICRHSALFPGMAQVLDALDARGVPAAIVTNKPVALAGQLLHALDLHRRFVTVIGGDSLAERKPHPLPLLVACERMGVAPGRVLMVGDDRRDIEAGRAAGSRTVAAAWGYADAGEVAAWQADVVLDRPLQLLDLLDP